MKGLNVSRTLQNAVSNTARNVSKNAASGAVSNASKNVSAGVQNVSNKLKDAVNGDKGPVIILIAVVLLAFVAVIIYISFSLKASNLKGKSLLKAPVRLDELQSPVVIEAGDIPKPAVGREYTYSFWMYIENFMQYENNPQMIFYRGSQNTIADANPVVMMDGSSNKLYFVFKTQESSLAANVYDNNLQNVLSNSYFNNTELTLNAPNAHKHIIMSLDYVPLQRWVNIAIVVDNKLITIFMDGEIYTVKSVDEFKMMKQPEFDASGNKINYNLILDKTEGSIYMGKFKNSPMPSAYVSNVTFFNYAISINDVKKNYMSGPFTKNLLSMLGISSYGVRSPVYKIDEYQSK